jgi:hypothetical protein
MAGIKITAVEKTEICFKNECQMLGAPADNASYLLAFYLERSTLYVNRSRRAEAFGTSRCGPSLHLMYISIYPQRMYKKCCLGKIPIESGFFVALDVSARCCRHIRN